MSFFGTYLSFVGAFSLGVVAVKQTRNYNIQENVRREQERRRQVEPVFSIEIHNINKKIGGNNSILEIDPKEKKMKGDNFMLSIQNLSDYPVLHIRVADNYVCPAMKPGEVIDIRMAFADSEDAKRYPRCFQVILDADEEQLGNKEQGRLPKSFDICYEDVDGRKGYKVYSLLTMDSKRYYSLSETEVVSEQ